MAFKYIHVDSIQTYGKYKKSLQENNELKFPEDVKQATFLLNDAYRKIETLEEKIMSLETRVPKSYPDVHFLNYLSRKRILVCILFTYRNKNLKNM